MVFCAVYGCSHRSERDKYSFYRIPSIKRNYSSEMKALQAERRALWILRISRSDFNATKANHSRVCSNHFVSGAPAALKDTSNIDWAPSLNLGHDFFNSKDELERRKSNFEISQDITEVSTSDMKDPFEIEDIILAANESDSMNEETANRNCDKSGQDRLKYFIFGSSKSSDSEKTSIVSHEKALKSAETLLHYMQNQDDVDHADVTLIMGYIKKIKEKIKEE